MRRFGLNFDPAELAAALNSQAPAGGLGPIPLRQAYVPQPLVSAPVNQGLIDKGLPVTQTEVHFQEVPWMDQTLIGGMKNRWLVYAGGAIGIAVLGMLWASKTKRMEGYRRRRSRRSRR